MRPGALPPGPMLCHVTANSGHMRWSPRNEVPDRILATLTDQLRLAVHVAGPVPLRNEWTFHATADGGALSADVLAPGGEAVACIAVGADASPETRAAWSAAIERCPWHIPPCDPADLAEPPEPPWVLGVMLPPLARHPMEVAWWLADVERFIGWAWIEARA